MTYQPQNWPIIEDRIAYLSALAQGLDVLNIGCTGKKSNGRRPKIATTLHYSLGSCCKSLVGVDIDLEGVDGMREHDFDVFCADVTTMRLERRFDLIVAGEIIEHLFNPQFALVNMKNHLKPEGILVLTTPNPFYYRQQSKILRKGAIHVHREHTAWYDPFTLRVMLDGAGLEITQGAWLQTERIRRGYLRRILKWRCYWHPNFLVQARIKP